MLLRSCIKRYSHCKVDHFAFIENKTNYFFSFFLSDLAFDRRSIEKVDSGKSIPTTVAMVTKE